jgi:Sulfotransferase family
MVISDAPPFLFVHIPKTAGTSLTVALRPEGALDHPLCLPGDQHETISAFIARHGEATFNRFKPFSIVRHPVDRLVSHFSYLKTNAEQFPEMADVHTPDDYVSAFVAGHTTISRYRFWIPQIDYVSLGDRVIEHVWRYEELATAWEAICEYAGLAARDLPVLNVSRHQAEATRTVQRFVADHFARDFEEFNY